MCRRVDCPKCGRPTFAGCGRHVEQVLGDVPRAQRCQGHDAQPVEAPGKGDGGDLRSRLRALFGK
jgi:hypothetical protein